MMRVLSSILLVPLVVWLVFWAPHWVLPGAVACIAAVCFREYSGLVAAHGIPPPGPLGYAAGILLIAAPQKDTLAITLLAILALGLGLQQADLGKALPRAAALVLGVLYVFGGWWAAVALHSFHPHWLMFGLILNWAGDTSAYLVGRAVGRHRMAPVVSPKKSWEGAAGSLAFSLLAGFLYARLAIPAAPLLQVLLLAAAVNVAAQVGDLAESAIKRGANVKDSGTLLPGHGGWLDRVDGTLFSLPVLYFLLLRWPA